MIYLQPRNTDGGAGLSSENIFFEFFLAAAKRYSSEREGPTCRACSLGNGRRFIKKLSKKFHSSCTLVRGCGFVYVICACRYVFYFFLYVCVILRSDVTENQVIIILIG